MAIRIIKIKSYGRSFTPKITANGLNVAVSEASLEFDDEQATVDALEFDLDKADAGKFLYLSLMRRKEKDYYYHLITQDPQVMKPMIAPVGDGVEELFPVLSGKISNDGTRLDLEVRHFIKA